MVTDSRTHEYPSSAGRLSDMGLVVGLLSALIRPSPTCMTACPPPMAMNFNKRSANQVEGFTVPVIHYSLPFPPPLTSPPDSPHPPSTARHSSSPSGGSSYPGGSPFSDTTHLRYIDSVLASWGRCQSKLSNFPLPSPFPNFHAIAALMLPPTQKNTPAPPHLASSPRRPCCFGL